MRGDLKETIRAVQDGTLDKLMLGGDQIIEGPVDLKKEEAPKPVEVSKKVEEKHVEATAAPELNKVEQ